MPTTDFILATAITGGPRSAGRGDWGSEERITRSPEHLQQCPVRALCASHLADTCKWVKSTHPGFQQAHMGPQAITSYPCSTAKLWNFSENCSLSAKQMIIPTAQCGVVWVFFFFLVLCVLMRWCINSTCWCQSLSHVQVFVTTWIVAHQAPLTMGFSGQDYWNRLTFSPPRDLPTTRIKLRSAALKTDSLLSEPPGNATLRLTSFIPQKLIFQEKNIF